MAAVVILDKIVVTAGAYQQFSGLTFSTGTLTAIAGIDHTVLGGYVLRTGNGINGGVPNQGPTSFVLFTAAATIVPSGGSYQQFSGLTFSPSSTLTAAAGIFDSLLGSYRVPKTARGFLSVSTPPVVGTQIIVFVSM
jgi:hypothetical protein